MILANYKYLKNTQDINSENVLNERVKTI
jgi:hypothetical protein